MTNGRRYALALALLSVAGWAAAEEPPSTSGKDLVVTKHGGTRYLSLKDWPETREGSIIRRATLEEYLSLKFGQLDERLTNVHERLAAVEQQLRQLEEHHTGLQAQVRLLEARPALPKPPEVRHGDTAAQVPEGERPAQPAP